MKKRIKITLRTKIYLTIVALVSADRNLLRRQSNSLCHSRRAQTAWPLSRLWCSRPNSSAKISVLSTARGMSRRWRRSRVPSYPVEKYLAVAPIQSTAAGFTPRDVFITQGADIFKFSGGIVTPFATLGCPFSDHSSLTFDHVGTFGFDLIATCENGPVWKVDGAGTVTPIAIVGSGGEN